MLRTITVAAVAAMTFAGTPVSAQGLFKKLARAAEERVAQTVQSGDLPSLSARSAAGVNQGSQGVTGPLGGFERYGNWEFRFEKLELGTDDQWQAVIAVRNPENHRQGMVASEIKLALITQDGETLQSWGEIYKASIEGASVGLEPVPGTMWLEKGDMIRIRLRFDGSRGMRPARLRIASTGATAKSRTFPVSGS